MKTLKYTLTFSLMVVIMGMGYVTFIQYEQNQYSEQKLQKLKQISVANLKKNMADDKPKKQSTIMVARTCINHFFKIYHTFSNSNQYKARQTKLKDYAVADVVNDKNLFTDDTDVSGKSYIDISGLESTTDAVDYFPSESHDQETQGFVVVKYTAQFKKNGANENNMIYAIKYDRGINRLTSITFVGQEYPMLNSTTN